MYERTGFFGSATRAELVALWQQRTETARADDVRSDADRPLRTEAELRQAISAAVIASVPPPWRAVDLEFREVGGHAELICRSVGADGAARFWSPHPAVSQAFGELRTTSAASERGVWLAAALRVRPDGSPGGISHDDETTWFVPPPIAALDTEISRHPRPEDARPAWWRALTNNRR